MAIFKGWIKEGHLPEKEKEEPEKSEENQENCWVSKKKCFKKGLIHHIECCQEVKMRTGKCLLTSVAWRSVVNCFSGKWGKS